MCRSRFLDLGTSWRWVVSLMPRPLYPRRTSPRYPLDRRLGGPQNRSGRCGEENILESTKTRTPTSRYTDRAIPALQCNILHDISIVGLARVSGPFAVDVSLGLRLGFHMHPERGGTGNGCRLEFGSFLVRTSAGEPILLHRFPQSL
jgi:hypothetical protein